MNRVDCTSLMMNNVCVLLVIRHVPRVSEVEKLNVCLVRMVFILIPRPQHVKVTLHLK